MINKTQIDIFFKIHCFPQNHKYNSLIIGEKPYPNTKCKDFCIPTYVPIKLRLLSLTNLKKYKTKKKYATIHGCAVKSHFNNLIL